MKIKFNDDSFLQLLPNYDEGKVTIIICGKKGPRQVTMSAVDLSAEQVNEIIDFLTSWSKE